MRLELLLCARELRVGDQFATLVFWLVILTPIVVFARQVRRVRNGERGRGRGVLLFVAYSLLPIAAYILGFFALVGIEEVSGAALIGESFARTLPFAVGIGLLEVLLLTIVFSIVIFFLKPVARPE